MTGLGEQACAICGSRDLTAGTAGYHRCRRCGHETRRSEEPGSPMINELLSAERMGRPDLKDRFQIRITLQAALKREGIIDIGAGSGRLLAHLRSRFRDHLGIEVTPECLAFARDVLHLTVTDALTPEKAAGADVVTFWHSLEHLPTTTMRNLLAMLAGALPAHARIVVSVPNVSSLHFRLFGRNSVYFDPTNHVHQFSAASLDLVMGEAGFQCWRRYTGLGYSWIGNALSLLNVFSTEHNFLYLELRRRRSSGGWRRRARLAGGAFALVLAMVATLPLFAFEALFPRNAAVLTTTFRRSRREPVPHGEP